MFDSVSVTCLDTRDAKQSTRLVVVTPTTRRDHSRQHGSATVSVEQPIDGTEDPVQVGGLTRSARNGGYMSTTLAFTRVTPEELDRAIKDPEWALEHLQDADPPYYSLEKSWAGIQFLLDEAEVEVELHEDGCIIDKQSILSGWSDRMVAEAATTLSATPFEVLAGHYDPRKLSEQEVYPWSHLWDDDGIDDLRDNYVDLVEFFEETAALGGALIREISF
jgi:hypothetical protein